MKTYKSKNYRIGYEQAIKDIESQYKYIGENGFIIPKGSEFMIDGIMGVRILTISNMNDSAIHFRKIGNCVVIQVEQE